MTIYEIIHYILEAGIIGILVLVIRGQRSLLNVRKDLDKLKEQRIEESDKVRETYRQFFQDAPGLMKQYKDLVSQLSDEDTARLEQEIDKLKREIEQKNLELSMVLEEKLEKAPEVRAAAKAAKDSLIAAAKAAKFKQKYKPVMTPVESQLLARLINTIPKGKLPDWSDGTPKE